ncbi:hypothetical protein MUP77_08540 [Candidatus Bathyarchaeota archaeon]|nr:hypothetical protein [Candidatus Bathyarchaeota archaeon]
MFELPILNKGCKTLKAKPLRLYRNPIALAQEWQKALEDKQYASRADLAGKIGVSRARVTQILRLLNLSTEVQKTLISLGDPLTRPTITERKLRSIVDLPQVQQRWKIEAILNGKKMERSK